MLNQTLAQPLIFLMLILFGFASGIIFDVSNFILKLCKNNRILKHFLDFFASLLTFVVFFICIFTFNFGELRLYEFLVFFSSFSLERFSVGKIVEKIIGVCYNAFVKFVNKINSRGKRHDEKLS